MKEGDFPIFSPEGEHENSEKDDDSEDSKEKKKKNTFKKWIEFFVPKRKQGEDKETNQEEEARQDRAEGIFARARGFLNRLTGVETEVEPDNEETEPEEDEYDPLARRRFDLSNLLEVTDDDVPDTKTESETSTAERLNQDNEQDTPEGKEAPPSDRNTEGDAAHVRRETEEGNVPEIQDNEPSDLGYERLYTAGSDNTERANTERDQSTIIQRRGSGAALAGFVAGELLSRSRDKKLKKEASKLRDQLNKQETHSNEQDLELLRQKQEMQRQSLQQKRSIENSESPVAQEVIFEKVQKEHSPEPLQKKSVKESDVVTEPTALPVQKKLEEVGSGESVDVPYASKREERYTQSQEVFPEETLAKTRPEVSKEEQLHLQQIEQAADSNVALEAFYEKRHESKDVASTQSSQVVAGLGVPDSSQSQQQRHTKGGQPTGTTGTGYTDNDSWLPQDPKADSSYRQAMKRGAVAGLAIVISLCIIALIWSLV